MKHIDIVVLDFGSQYNQLIVRRIRELGVYAELFPFSTSYDEIKSLSPKGIILSGGPFSLLDDPVPQFDRQILSLKIPILGICYGMQFISHIFGGKLIKGEKREYGYTKIYLTEESPIFLNTPKEQIVWMSHEDVVITPPEGFKITSKTDKGLISSIENIEKEIYALQFHPEVSHTEYGKKIFENFITKIVKAERNWNTSIFIEETIENVKREVKKEKVIIAVSGGVDSTVLTVFLHKALGKNLIPIFINNGLLRKNEEKEVINNFKSLGIEIKYIDASQKFLNRLKGIRDPEKKRKIIGNTFIDVFEEASKPIKAKYLAQGTLYPDVIESGKFGPSDTIKTHHNVGGLPEKMNLKLIEPFKYLFKDEVREIGKKLGIPKEILYRHPFPGPGLAVRILGEITPEKLKILREADAIFIEELKKENLYQDIWQAFCVLLPVKSVGVKGDKRSYGYVLSIRAVHSLDAMTADWVRLPYEFLNSVSNKILSSVKEITRICYDITSKPPGTIEWE